MQFVRHGDDVGLEPTLAFARPQADAPVGKVNILPPHAEQLAPARSGVQRCHQEGLQAGQTRLEKEDAATAKLLAINGYDAATRMQSALPSGASISDMVSWVRGGFAPQNQALKAAGLGGVDIGAMPVTTAQAPSGVTPWGASQWGTTPWANGTTPWGKGKWGQ